MNKKVPRNVSDELSTNLVELRNKVVKEGDIDIITQQTGIEDKLEIERMLIECGNDVSSTILNLMSLKAEEKQVKEPTLFDKIREILDDKDKVYHDAIAKNRQQQQ
jgi:hypothetical protein